MTGHAPGVYDIPEAEYFADPGSGVRADPEVCDETSDSEHCHHWYEPADRCCCACGAVNWAELETDQ